MKKGSDNLLLSFFVKKLGKDLGEECKKNEKETIFITVAFDNKLSFKNNICRTNTKYPLFDFFRTKANRWQYFFNKNL